MKIEVNGERYLVLHESPYKLSEDEILVIKMRHYPLCTTVLYSNTTILFCHRMLPVEFTDIPIEDIKQIETSEPGPPGDDQEKPGDDNVDTNEVK